MRTFFDRVLCLVSPFGARKPRYRDRSKYISLDVFHFYRRMQWSRTRSILSENLIWYLRGKGRFRGVATRKSSVTMIYPIEFKCKRKSSWKKKKKKEKENKAIFRYLERKILNTETPGIEITEINFIPVWYIDRTKISDRKKIDLQHRTWS